MWGCLDVALTTLQNANGCRIDIKIFCEYKADSLPHTHTIGNWIQVDDNPRICFLGEVPKISQSSSVHLRSYAIHKDIKIWSQFVEAFERLI